MNTIGNKVIRLDEVDSTNLYAERLLDGNAVEEGTVIAALYQTAGKGQGSNTWNSGKGLNLIITVVLMPVFLRADRQFLLNMAVSLGACDFLSGIGMAPEIKWPNDLYVSNGKIGGILITHRVTGITIGSSVVGIGINLNQVTFPDDITNPVSVKMLTGQSMDPEIGLNRLVSALDEKYSRLVRGEEQEITNDYLAKLKWIGQWKVFESENRRFEGKIVGVNEFGLLVVGLRNGNHKVFSHGEISLAPF